MSFMEEMKSMADKIDKATANQQSGFGPKRKPKKAEVIYKHVFKDLIPGDVALSIEASIKSLNLSYEEVCVMRTDDHGREREEPFIRYQLEDGLEIPVGTYRVDGLGDIEVGLDKYNTIPALEVRGNLLGSNSKPIWNEFIKRTKVEASKTSIFRGKALMIDSPHDLLIPRLLPLETEVALFFNPKVEEQLDTCLFWPIANRLRCKEIGVRTRRGAILEGHYGAGKSILMYKAAQVAQHHKWGVLHITSGMIQIALYLAPLLEPVCIIIEDIDSSTHGDRDRLNGTLNALSSVSTKTKGDYFLLVSTNFLDRIDPALLRPERIDAIINIELPEVSTVSMLIRHFANGHLVGDIEAISARLVGTTPAIISEIVQRSLIDGERFGTGVTEGNMLAHTEWMQKQMDLALPQLREDSTGDQLAKSLYAVTQYGI